LRYGRKVAGPKSLRAELVRHAVRERLFGPSEPLRLGRYEVRDHLGAGAMGSVFVARDPDLDREVALKILPNESGVQRRVQREARAMAKLRHPNVVAVYEVGTVEDRAFIAMEYVEGSTLAGWLAESPRSVEPILEAFRQAGRGLAAAHAAGVIHRDFKPDNVLVARDGRVQVTDFGVAEAGARVEAIELTPGGNEPVDHARTDLSRAGTPRYMAPEQHGGGEVSAKSDQFAFCVALFEALFGEPPFRADTLRDLAEATRQERLIEPPPRDDVPAAVLGALRRGLRADPEQRFASMDELLAALAPPAARHRRWPYLAVVAIAASAVASVVATCERPPLVVPPPTVVTESRDDHAIELAAALAAAAIDEAAAAVTRGGAEAPRLTEDACQSESSSCRLHGRCKAQNGACVAASSADCEVSAICRIAGRCAAEGDACIAASDDHCETAEICKRDGACSAREGRCQP
jgi:eukaryotic-like serine/threonine-protein kinase